MSETEAKRSKRKAAPNASEDYKEAPTAKKTQLCCDQCGDEWTTEKPVCWMMCLRITCPQYPRCRNCTHFLCTACPHSEWWRGSVRFAPDRLTPETAETEALSANQTPLVMLDNPDNQKELPAGQELIAILMTLDWMVSVLAPVIAQYAHARMTMCRAGDPKTRDGNSLEKAEHGAVWKRLGITYDMREERIGRWHFRMALEGSTQRIIERGDYYPCGVWSDRSGFKITNGVAELAVYYSLSNFKAERSNVIEAVYYATCCGQSGCLRYRTSDQKDQWSHLMVVARSPYFTLTFAAPQAAQLMVRFF